MDYKLLQRGNYVNLLIFETSIEGIACNVFFSGYIDGTGFNIGRTTFKRKDNDKIMRITNGLSYGNRLCLHSFIERGKRFKCRMETGEAYPGGIGHIYEGLCSHGKKHGEGVYYYPDGTVVKGTWQNDEKDGPAEIQITLKNINRKATIFANFTRSKMDSFGKVVFDDDKSIYVGKFPDTNAREIPWNPLHGQGILLDSKGIHAGMWKHNRMIGDERLELCDGSEIIVMFEHSEEAVVEKERCIRVAPISVILEDDLSPLALLQKFEIAVFLGKRRMIARLLCATNNEAFSFQDVSVISMR